MCSQLQQSASVRNRQPPHLSNKSYMYSLEEIAEITGLTLEEVQALAQEIQESV